MKFQKLLRQALPLVLTHRVVKINQKKEEAEGNGTISHISDAEINVSENLLLGKLGLCMCSALSFPAYSCHDFRFGF